jgi:multidrug resistance efflux pump
MADEASSPPERHTIIRLGIPLLLVATILGCAALAALRWDLWIGNARRQATDDAYITADLTRLSSRVAGEVLNVAVDDFQRVKSGDLLVQIDPADYQAQVDQADANVNGAQAVLENLKNQIELQYASIAQAEAARMSAEALEVEARQEQERQQVLSRTDAGTRQRLEQAIAAYAKAQADVRASRALIAAQQHQLEVLQGTKKQRAAELQAAKALLAATKLKLGYTEIVAPFDGVVSQRKVQSGDYVNIGANLINSCASSERLCNRQLQGNPTHPCEAGSARRDRGRHIPEPDAARSCRAHFARQRVAVCTAAAGQRHREFHQGRATHSSQDSAGRGPVAPVASAARDVGCR